MSSLNDFGFIPDEDNFGFVPDSKQNQGKESDKFDLMETVKEIPTQLSKGILTGAGGTYGDILDFFGLQSKKRLPGELAKEKREFEASEKELPLEVDSDDILPRYSRLPSSKQTEEVIEKSGIEKVKTPFGRAAERGGRLIGGGIAFGSPTVSTALKAGALGQTAEELGAPKWLQAAIEIGTYIKAAPRNVPITSKTPEIEKKISDLRKLGYSEEDLTLAKNALEDRGYLAKTATMTSKAEKSFEENIKKSEKNVNDILNTAFPGLEKGIERAGQNASEFYQGINNLASSVKVENPSIFIKNLEKSIDQIKKIPAVGKRKEALEYLEEGINRAKESKNGDFYTEYYRGLNELGNWANPKTKEHVLKLVKDGVKNTLAAQGEEGYKFAQMFDHANDVWSKFKSAEELTNLLKPAISETEINFSKLEKLLSKPENYETVKDTLGSIQAQNLKQISEASSKISNLRDKILGGPLKKNAVYAELAAIGYSLWTGNYEQIAAIMGAEVARRAATKFLTDPKYQNNIKKMIKAVDESKWDQFRIITMNLQNDLKKD